MRPLWKQMLLQHLKYVSLQYHHRASLDNMILTNQTLSMKLDEEMIQRHAEGPSGWPGFYLGTVE